MKCQGLAEPYVWEPVCQGTCLATLHPIYPPGCMLMHQKKKKITLWALSVTSNMSLKVVARLTFENQFFREHLVFFKDNLLAVL